MTDGASFGMARRSAFGVLVLCLALAGCSSSAKKVGSSSTSSSSSAAAGAIDPATKTAITQAYARFFNPKTPEALSLASLQHGQQFKAVVEQQAKGSQAQSASVKVSAVQLLSAKVAQVTFTIYTQGQAVLPNTKGKAVLENGHWEVSAETFCALLKLEGAAPASCSDPKFTAPPS